MNTTIANTRFFCRCTLMARLRLDPKLIGQYWLILVNVFAMQAYALDESRLWLPTKHHRHYLDLKESALAAERLDVCVEVLRGTLDFDQSREGKLIFRILCRREDGLSYNEMVDGLTKETLTTKSRVDGLPTEEELEAIRKAKEARKQEFKSACLALFEKQTEFMIDLVLLTDKDAEPEFFDEQSAIFTHDFDASGISGGSLKYRAKCQVGIDKPAELSIKPRK